MIRSSVSIMIWLLLTVPAFADTVLATRTIRAQSLIMPTDVMVTEGHVPGAAKAADQIVGMEARVALYEGRPIQLSDDGPPAVIQRNQIVPLVFQKSGLQIIAEGRSLSRASPGERVRVMNISSRPTVRGWVDETGTVFVTR